jgi:hypothetical protein
VLLVAVATAVTRWQPGVLCDDQGRSPLDPRSTQPAIRASSCAATSLRIVLVVPVVVCVVVMAVVSSLRDDTKAAIASQRCSRLAIGLFSGLASSRQLSEFLLHCAAPETGSSCLSRTVRTAKAITTMAFSPKAPLARDCSYRRHRAHRPATLSTSCLLVRPTYGPPQTERQNHTDLSARHHK